MPVCTHVIGHQTFCHLAMTSLHIPQSHAVRVSHFIRPAMSSGDNSDQHNSRAMWANYMPTNKRLENQYNSGGDRMTPDHVIDSPAYLARAEEDKTWKPSLRAGARELSWTREERTCGCRNAEDVQARSKRSMHVIAGLAMWEN